MENIYINDSLRLFAFRIDVDIHSPYIAVRQIDCAILRTEEKTRNKRRISTEQAQRAQIRQILLNINLKSEKATREEITHLKNAGILGKRAPSCSLLNAEDAVRLLMAFGKEDIANDLAKALSDYRARNPLPDGTIRPSIDPQAIAPSIRVNFTSASYSGTEEEDGEPPAVPRSTRPPRHIVAATPLYTPDYDSDSDEDNITADGDKRKRTLVKRVPRPKQPARVSASPTAVPASGPSVSMMFAPLNTPTAYNQGYAPHAQYAHHPHPHAHAHAHSLQQHAHGHVPRGHADSPSSHLVAAAAAHPQVQASLFSNPNAVSVSGMSLARPSPSHAHPSSAVTSAVSPRHAPSAVSRHTPSSAAQAASGPHAGSGIGFRSNGYSFHDSLSFMNPRSNTNTNSSSSSLASLSAPQPPSLLPSSLSTSSSLGGLASTRVLQGRSALPNTLSNSLRMASTRGLSTPLLANNYSGYGANTLGALAPSLSPAHGALTPHSAGQGLSSLQSPGAGSGLMRPAFPSAAPSQLR